PPMANLSWAQGLYRIGAVELQQLKGFLAIAKTRSITKAAQQLRYTPSAVSVQIKKLEQELGVRLFDRTRSGLMLTGSGKLFLEIALPAIESLERAEVIVKDTTGELVGNIVIATVYDVKQYYLPALANFAKTHRKVNLTILTRDKAEIVSLLTSREIDFAMARINPDPRQFLIHHLISPGFSLVIPKDHWLYRKAKISLQDMKDCRFVFLPKSTTSRQLVEEKFYRAGYVLNVNFEAWSCADIIDCALLGLGPGIVHDICIPGGRRPFRVVDVTSIFGATDVNLVCRKDKFLSRADHALINAVLSYQSSSRMPA
ncbi:MAG TPA: LysR family transcriptional regulator, partial [Candidatus Eisenbacteria bacterium]|nr:LysR family transcriptional regulator [Candidatus Eisenbacteria bacterium]